MGADSPRDRRPGCSRARSGRARERPADAPGPPASGPHGGAAWVPCIGQALSSAELVATFCGSFWRPGRDHFAMPPSHYVVAAYAAGVELGLLAAEDRGHLRRRRLQARSDRRRVLARGRRDFGSLGQGGLSCAVGLALSNRLRGAGADTFALLSDGETQYGQVWEAVTFAAHTDLDRLVVLVDCNNSQVDGPVTEVVAVEPLLAKWQAFGWGAAEVDGPRPCRQSTGRWLPGCPARSQLSCSLAPRPFTGRRAAGWRRLPLHAGDTSRRQSPEASRNSNHNRRSAAPNAAPVALTTRLSKSEDHDLGVDWLGRHTAGLGPRRGQGRVTLTQQCADRVVQAGAALGWAGFILRRRSAATGRTSEAVRRGRLVMSLCVLASGWLSRHGRESIG